MEYDDDAMSHGNDLMEKYSQLFAIWEKTKELVSRGELTENGYNEIKEILGDVEDII